MSLGKASSGQTSLGPAYRDRVLLRSSKTKTALCCAAVLGALLPGTVADARPATAADFQILYYTTDEDGDRGRQMTLQDLQQYVNQARCQCNQRIEAKITLVASGEAFDQNRIRSYVGSNCAQGQVGTSPQFRACVLLDDQLPNFYTKSPSFDFATIWLASGVEDRNNQPIANATPRNDCSTGLGDAGIWVCVEDGMATDCQQSEFIINGTQNINGSPNGQQGGMSGMGQGLTFDFDPPLTVPTGFEASEGDGAVVISWDQMTTSDVNGFRVLCADANGNPLPDKGVGRPDITAENQGTLYFTAENLCPDGPFFDEPNLDDARPPDDDFPLPVPGDDDDDIGGTGGGSGGVATVGMAGQDAYDFWYGEGPVHGGGATMGPGGTAGTAGNTGGTGGDTGGDSGTAGDGRTDDGRTDDGGDTTGTGAGASGGSSGTAGTGGDAIVSPIQNMDWDYVCSGHLPFNTQEARVEGLDNGVDYQFLVVAYDVAGNPIEASEVLTATPRETSGLWEQCEAQGGVCGKGGFCNCTTGRDTPGAMWLSLLALGLVRRRRRRA